jgi:hypothetical protein
MPPHTHTHTHRERDNETRYRDGEGSSLVVLQLRLELGKAKVADLHLPFVVHEHVRGLYVAMNDTFRKVGCRLPTERAVELRVALLFLWHYVPLLCRYAMARAVCVAHLILSGLPELNMEKTRKISTKQHTNSGRWCRSKEWNGGCPSNNTP